MLFRSPPPPVAIPRVPVPAYVLERAGDIAARTALDDVVALPYSSRTTGLPKGVMLTHGNLVANIAQSAAALPMEGADTVIAVLPFFHIYGLQVILNGGLHAGATLVVLPRFELETF